jgi:MFS family permease
VLIFLLIGVAVLAAFVVVELQVRDPVLDLRLFMNYTFTISNILRWLVIGVFYGGLFLLPLFFENVQGNTALTTGQFLLGQGLMIGVGMTVAGLLYNRLGPRTLTVFGLLLLVVSTYQLAQVDVNTTGQILQLSLLLRGLGVGIVNQPLQTLAHSVVSNKGMAKASSLVNATRQVATASAVAVLATYLTEQTAKHTTDISNALHTHHLTGIAATCAQTADPTQHLTATACVAQHALAASVADTFWIILILSAICIPLGLVMGRDPAIEGYKRAKQAKATTEEIQITSTPNVVSTLAAHGGETMGPETLLWRYYENNIVPNSLLKVESNQFCVLRLHGQILNVYEAGQHILQDTYSSFFGSIQLTFSGEPISWPYEILYINRTKLTGNVSGILLSRDMIVVDYHVDYTIHIATCADAIQLVQHMLYGGHTFSIQEVSAHAGPIIEEVVNQLLLITPLEPVEPRLATNQELQMIQSISHLLHQRLQQFLSSYGITLDTVKVQRLSSYDKRILALIS